MSNLNHHPQKFHIPQHLTILRHVVQKPTIWTARQRKRTVLGRQEREQSEDHVMKSAMHLPSVPVVVGLQVSELVVGMSANMLS